jgi:glycosyltransferase involved in cell wall biosynthesis
VVVAGFFRSASGIGEAARACFRALTTAGLSPSAVDLTVPIAPADLAPEIPLSAFPGDRHGSLLLHVNPPEMLAALAQLDFLGGRHWRVIGCWAWELPTFPTGWERGFELVSDIWVPSVFTAEALRKHRQAPAVAVIPHAIDPPAGIVADRARFGIGPNVFAALTTADALSSFARKNPLGAIDAFRRAFGDRTDVQLIVKTRNLAHSPATAKFIKEAIGGSSNIRLLDGTLAEADRWSLLRSVDALISLHRAEGFALGPAEAMSLGKPVIATGWSGNLDFMAAGSALLVDYELIPVLDPFGVYSDPTARWAEPNIAQAAELLRRVAAEPAWSAAIGDAGRRQVATVCDPRKVGSEMARLLAATP